MKILASLLLLFLIISVSGCIAGTAQVHTTGTWKAPTLALGILATNPQAVQIHIDAANTGNADARDVIIYANMYYQQKQICSQQIDLGSIKAEEHYSQDTIMSCNMPTGASMQNLDLRLENMAITT